MSYIKCKSFITGEEVQYGLIEAELTHKQSGEPYGSYSDYYVGRWNTCPSWFTTETLRKNNNGKYAYESVGTVGITGRPNNGVLTSNYPYVSRGKHPVISNSIYDVDAMQAGENIYNLFETENVLVQLKCIKFKVSELNNTTGNYSFTDLDGSLVEDPYLVGSVTIQEVLKSNDKVIGELDLLTLFGGSQIFPNKFAINTELFCIDNFVPNFNGTDTYNNRISFWYTAGNDIKDCKMLINGEQVSSSGRFVGLVFSIYSSDYYSTYRNYYNYTRFKVVNSDGSDVDESFIKQANTKAQTSYFLDCIDNNSSEFIQFVNQVSNWNTNYGTLQAQLDLAESVVNSDKSYKTIGYNQEIDTIFGANFLITPILAPFVNSSYNVPNAVVSGIYIPLTDTIYEGDPEEPVDPDEPETVEPADDPETDYTPSLPDDIKSGEETWEYMKGTTIGDEPGAYNSLPPAYGNYIFDHFLPIVDDEGNEIESEVGWSACNLIQNATASASFKRELSELLTGKPQLNELISRVYQIPFTYNQLFSNQVAIGDGTITYGFLGPVIYNKWAITPSDLMYYKVFKKRFLPIQLGNFNIDRVFNNYLDYTETTYKLFLPYGAGTVEIDPDLLFNGYVRPNDDDYHNIIINGYIDFDTGILIIKVLVNYQLYYQTSVNIAMDRIVTGADSELVNAIGKVAMLSGTAAIIKGMSQGSKPGRDFEKELDIAREKHDMRMAEIDKKSDRQDNSRTIKYVQDMNIIRNREEQRRATIDFKSEIADGLSYARSIDKMNISTHSADEQIRKHQEMQKTLVETRKANLENVREQLEMAKEAGVQLTYKAGGKI